MPVVGLLIIATMSSTSQAIPKGEQPLSETKQREVYTDELSFFQSRVYKLQEIIGRAQNAQRKIRNNPSYRTGQDQQQALNPWKRVENHARQMLAEMQDRTQTLKTKLVHKQLYAG
ncbi:MAG: hypothetical protein OEU26_23105, partial [Candidatus Tectomicrobia bacterium]|nr:hypothetical protein [Candidatus Tectomicrobia bacterium]